MPDRLHNAAGTLTVHQRRQALRLAQANGGLWAIGNGLASSTLIVYLASEFGARGLAVALILAAPQWAGLSRVWAADLVVRLGDRKKFCLRCYWLSNLLLVMLPLLCAPGLFGSHSRSLATLVCVWMLYHLTEYFGTVALWSWLGDLAPQRIRGRFLGRRERWLTFGRIVGVVFTGIFTYYWRNHLTERPLWIAYGVCASTGGAMMLLSLVPLARIPSIPLSRPAASPPSWAAIVAPFRDSRFMRLVAFGCWFSLVNGLTQAVQNISHFELFQFHLFWILAFQAAMRLGQGALCPWLGRLADRFGNRPLLIVSQLFVAVGPLFYYFAATGDRHWVAAAWVVWIAYAGLNVGLPNLMLKLSPGGNSASYIAAYFGVTGAIYGVGTVAGGALFDSLSQRAHLLDIGPLSLDRFQLLFLVGFAGRLLGVLLLLRLIEPGARRLLEMIHR